MDLKSYEMIRQLELDNKNLRAALVGASDNLRDAEMEIGRLRREISVLKGMVIRPMILEDGPPPVVGAPKFPTGSSSVFSEKLLEKTKREREAREEHIHSVFKKLAESESKDTNEHGDRVRIHRPLPFTVVPFQQLTRRPIHELLSEDITDSVSEVNVDEQGLTAERKRAGYDEDHNG